MNSYKTHNPESTRAIGKQIGISLQPGDVIGLSGPIGSGKTVFAQGVAEALGVKEVVNSPTFTIISEYQGLMKLQHMDLYRLNSSQEFAWLGVEEILEGNGVTVVEWSERAEDELPKRTIRVSISIEDDGARRIEIDDTHREKR